MVKERLIVMVALMAYLLMWTKNVKLKLEYKSD
jgi:hypothetical protein